MEQRLNLITLGVADLARSRAFYEALGWQAHPKSPEGLVLFDLNGIILGLFDRMAFAEDANVGTDPSSYHALALAHNVPNRDDVDSVMAKAEAAGATITQPASEVFWGGYRGYFSDPDAHLFEIAWNPLWPLDAQGRVQLPG